MLNGYDHIHKSTFFGFRLHARVDEQGAFCAVLLRPANEHDVTVAPRLLVQLSYRIITADKGYISQDFKRALDKHAVHLVTPRRSNQLPPPPAERRLYKNHRRVETAFSSLDRLGLSDRPYRSTIGFVVHVYTTILAYQLQGFLSMASHSVRLCASKLLVHLLCMVVLRIGVSHCLSLQIIVCFLVCHCLHDALPLVRNRAWHCAVTWSHLGYHFVHIFLELLHSRPVLLQRLPGRVPVLLFVDHQSPHHRVL